MSRAARARKRRGRGTLRVPLRLLAGILRGSAAPLGADIPADLEVLRVAGSGRGVVELEASSASWDGARAPVLEAVEIPIGHGRRAGGTDARKRPRTGGRRPVAAAVPDHPATEVSTAPPAGAEDRTARRKALFHAVGERRRGEGA